MKELMTETNKDTSGEEIMNTIRIRHGTQWLCSWCAGRRYVESADANKKANVSKCDLHCISIYYLPFPFNWPTFL